MRDCNHEWAWECGRMLCPICGRERPSDDTLEYAHERISTLERGVNGALRLLRDYEYGTPSTQLVELDDLLESMASQGSNR